MLVAVRGAKPFVTELTSDIKSKLSGQSHRIFENGQFSEAYDWAYKKIMQAQQTNETNATKVLPVSVDVGTKTEQKANESNTKKTPVLPVKAFAKTEQQIIDTYNSYNKIVYESILFARDCAAKNEINCSECDISEQKHFRKYLQWAYQIDADVEFEGRIWGSNAKRFMLRNVVVSFVDGVHGTIHGVEDHIWILEPTAINRCGVIHGDMIKFHGRVYSYRREDGSIDFSATDIKNVEPIDSYSTPSRADLIKQELSRLKCRTCSSRYICDGKECLNGNMSEYLSDTMNHVQQADTTELNFVQEKQENQEVKETIQPVENQAEGIEPASAKTEDNRIVEASSISVEGSIVSEKDLSFSGSVSAGKDIKCKSISVSGDLQCRCIETSGDTIVKGSIRAGSIKVKGKLVVTGDLII